MSLEQRTNRRARKKEETKKKIIAIALELFETQGFESTSMEQIAEKADVARGTLYNHFSNKEDIIVEYIQRTRISKKKQFESIITDQPDTRSRFITLLMEISEWNNVNIDMLKIYITYRFQNLHKSELGPGEQSGFAVMVEKIIRLGQERKEIRSELSANWLTSNFVILYFNAIMMWLRKPNDFSLNEELIEIVDLFLSGCQREN